MSNEINHGKPLPNPKDPSKFSEDPRRHRTFAPRRDANDVSECDVFGGEQKKAADARVKAVRDQQARDFLRRLNGKAPSDAEVKAFVERGTLS